MGAQAYGEGVYRFGECEFRAAERRLFIRGSRSALGSRALEVLDTLISNPGRVVTRNELLDKVWQGRVVEENNLTVQVTNLRKALGPDTISTLPGIGYRFSAALQGRPADVPSAPAATPATRTAAGNVAPFQPELIGRERERGEVVAGLARHRLVTIWGPGGMGKTMLARAVAADLRHDFSDGVWMIELAALPGPGSREDADEETAASREAEAMRALAGVVAETLEVKLTDAAPPAQQLAQALAGRHAMLVLDNCEHLVQAVSRLAAVLLGQNAQLRLLATSQVKLDNQQDQHPYELGPLSVPAQDDPAVASHGAIRLLVARIRTQHPRFELDARGSADAAEICRRLDGMPLAIELAAARVCVLGLAGVRARLHERLKMLTGGSVDAPERQRTLEKTLSWSHALLGAGARAAFRRAGVFAGSFGLEQAQQVLASDGEDPWRAIDHLATLVNRSLVVLERREPPRYRLLESARAYALQRLDAAGETATVLARHARATCELFESSLADEWQMPSQDRIERYMPDLDNGRAALAWAAESDAALYVRLAGALGWLFDMAIQNVEGLAHCIAARDRHVRPGTPARARARLHLAIALLGRVSLRAEAMRSAWRAARLADEAGDAALLYAALGRFAIASALCVRGARGVAALRIMRRLAARSAWPERSRWDVMNADDYVSNSLGWTAHAEDLARQQYLWAEEHGDVHKTMFGVMAQEQCAAARGDYGEAVRLGRRLVEMTRRHRHVRSRHVFVYNLASALAMSGRLEESLALARQSIAEERRLQTLDQELELMARLALLRGRPQAAALVIGRSEADNAWRADRREPVERNTYEAVIAELRRAADWPALDALRLRGSRLPLERAVDLALGDDDAHPALLQRVLAELDELERLERARADAAVDQWNHAVRQETRGGAVAT